MSSEQDQARLIAERIARQLAQSGGGEGAASSGPRAARDGDEDVGGELATLRAGLAELQQRLAHLESHIKEDESDGASGATGQGESRRERSVEQSQSHDAPPTRSPWLSGMYVPATHPSDERFGVAEAAVSELVDFFEKEKTCSMEPGNKPCDHCAMCSSRGF